MIGTSVQPRSPAMTSSPSMSGSPRSRRTTSGGSAAARAQGRGAVVGHHRLVAPGPQVDRQRLGQRLVVLDDQHPGHGATWRRTIIVVPSGVDCDSTVAVHGLHEAFDDRQSEPAAAGETRAPRAPPAGRPGPRSATVISAIDPSCVRAHRDVSPPVPFGVVDQVRQDAFEQSVVGEHQREVFGDLDGELCRSPAPPARRPRGRTPARGAPTRRRPRAGSSRAGSRPGRSSGRPRSRSSSSARRGRRRTGRRRGRAGPTPPP